MLDLRKPAKTPLRYLLLSLEFYPDVARGGGRYSYNLFQFARKHFSAVALTLRHGSNLQMEGVKQVKVPWRVPPWYRSLKFQLAYAVYALWSLDSTRRFNPSVIHACNIHETIVPMLLRRPFILTIHDESSFRIGRTSRLLLYPSLARADVILVPTETVKQTVQSAIAARKMRSPEIVVLSNFVEKREFDNFPLGANTRDRRLALFVGAIQTEKGVRALVKAFEHLDSSVKLVMVGQLIESYLIKQLPSNVTYLGRVSREQLVSLYRECSIVVLPSVTHEGQGIALLEAMAAGKPIVAGDIPAFREVAGGAALFVDGNNESAIASSIQELLDDANLYAKLSSNARNRSISAEDVENKFVSIVSEYAGQLDQQLHPN